MPVMSKPGFLAKTDSGFRRLFSEEVWSWGKEKKAREASLTDPDVLQNIGAKQGSYTNTSLRSSRKHTKPEEQLQSKEKTSQHKHKSLKTMDDSAETDPVTGSKTPKRTHICLQGKCDSLEKSNGNISSDETSSPSSSASSSSSGRPLRIRSLPNSPEGSWSRSQKTVGTFASLPEFQRAVAICINISDVFVSSLDIDEDLPFDLEDSEYKFANPCSQNDGEITVGPSSDLCMDCKRDVTGENTVPCNIHNHQRLENVPSININFGSSSTGTDAFQCVSPVACAGGEIQSEHEFQKEICPLMASHFHGSSVQDIGDGDVDISHESSSVDDGPLDTEEKSEAFSHSSEGLVSSGDEMVFNIELDNSEKSCNLDSNGQLEVEKSDILSSEQSNIFQYKQKQLFFDIGPESSFSSLEKQMLRQNSGINKPVDFSSWKTLVSEETLSEILSPVDEILSYGSAELPPSLVTVAGSDKGNYMFPAPPPASEIITWTSEEDFVPPPEDLDKFQANRSLTEDPSIVSEDLPSLSEDFFLSLNKEESDRQMDKINCEVLESDRLITNSEITSQNKKLWDNNRHKTQYKNSHSNFIFSKVNDVEGCSDDLPNFSTSDRVFVCHSKLGQQKTEETLRVHGGCWAGVTLDSSIENHNGTFHDAENFEYDKHHWVPVRVEDVSHFPREQECELDDDPFSDEELPSGDKQEQRWREAKYSGDGHNERKNVRKNVKKIENDSSDPRMMCKDATPLQELNNNTCSSCTGSCNNLFLAVIDQLQQSTNNTNVLKKDAPSDYNGLRAGSFQQNTKYPYNVECSECLTGREDQGDICDKKLNPVLASSIKSFLDQAPLQEPLPGGIAQEAQQGNPILDVSEKETVKFLSKCHRDLNSLVEKLAEDLIKEIMTDAQALRGRFQWKRSSLQDDRHNLDRDIKKTEDNHARANQLGFSDQWHCALSPSVSLKIQAHDPVIVHHLVASAMERLCGQAMSCKVDITDAPDYLINEESRKSYQQVIFDLTSEVLEEILQEHPTIFGFPWKTNQASSLSTFQPSKSFRTHIKAVVQTEVQRVLNLDRSDVQMREILQEMCKYGKAQRDKVDYILIQELHKEELQWVDYSLDQLTMKIRLTDEIFNMLLQDTISVLNKIHRAPPNVDPSRMQASHPFFGQLEQD